MYKLIEPDTVEYSEKLFKLLDLVNRYYNKFQYVSDMIQFDQLDYWSARIEEFGRGDCDDYALSKRKDLMEKGVPYECLFPTICTVYGEGHLVLVVRTSQGDLLLDSIKQTVEDVSKVNYFWCYRLDPINKRWLKIY